jgi:WD40 repeat protein
MNTRDSFDGLVSGWLDEQAGRGAPDYLDEVLARTTRTRQRPAWSSLERWLPLQLAYSARVAPINRLVWALFVLAVLVLTVSVLLMAGVGQRKLPHFGAAANGEFAFIDAGSLKVSAADGTNVRTVSSFSTSIEQLTFSPDGTLMAYRTSGSSPAIVVAAADGSGARVVTPGVPVAGGMPIAWSPDSRRLAFTELVGDRTIGTIDIVNADGSHLARVVRDGSTETHDRFAAQWSPDGQWIAYLSTEANKYIAINLIRPDGSDPRQLATSAINPDFAVVRWSPDPARQQLVYVAGDYVKVFDLATATETTIAPGQWPSWSPDGTRIAWYGDGSEVVALAHAGDVRPTQLFGSHAIGYCNSYPNPPANISCGPIEWSPDGVWVFSADADGTSILIARSDGTGPVRAIRLAASVWDVGGSIGQFAWQAVAP